MHRYVYERWFPIVLARPAGTATDADHLEFLAATGELLERRRAARQRFVLILDLSRAGPLNSLQRRRQVDWLSKYRPILEEISVGMAFVIPSLILRGVLTSMFWLVPPPTTHIIVVDLDQAIRWALDRATVDGLSVPAEVSDRMGHAFVVVE